MNDIKISNDWKKLIFRGSCSVLINLIFASSEKQCFSEIKWYAIALWPEPPLKIFLCSEMRVFKFRSVFLIYVELHSPHVIEYPPFLCIFSILYFLLLLISDPMYSKIWKWFHIPKFRIFVLWFQKFVHNMGLLILVLILARTVENKLDSELTFQFSFLIFGLWGCSRNRFDKLFVWLYS